MIIVVYSSCILYVPSNLRIEDTLRNLAIKVESLESQIKALSRQPTALLPQQSSGSYCDKELNKQLLSMLNENQVSNLHSNLFAL